MRVGYVKWFKATLNNQVIFGLQMAEVLGLWFCRLTRRFSSEFRSLSASWSHRVPVADALMPCGSWPGRCWPSLGPRTSVSRSCLGRDSGPW